MSAKRPSQAFRVVYRRQGWSSGRETATDVFVSRRKATNKLAKLAKATLLYGASPIVSARIESGAIVWTENEDVTQHAINLQGFREMHDEPEADIIVEGVNDEATRLRLLHEADRIAAETALTEHLDWEAIERQIEDDYLDAELRDWDGKSEVEWKRTYQLQHPKWFVR